MRELLTAIGLAACYSAEVTIRLRSGQPQIAPETFLKSASPLFMLPPDFLRALQCEIKFTQPPPGVKLAIVDNNGSQDGGGLGRDHRVGGGPQRVYPFRRDRQ